MPEVAALPLSDKVAGVPEFFLSGVAASRPAPAALGAELAARGHGHHLIKLAGLALLMLAAAIAAGYVIARLARRARARRGGAAGPDAADDDHRDAAVTVTTAQPAEGAKPTERASPEPAVAVRHLTKTYRMGSVAVRALDDVSLEIPAGAIACVTGRSGSGKSTLLRQLGLLDLPSRGRIWLNGSEVTRVPERQRAALRLTTLGYVFQEYALLPELTAAENVCLPAMMAGRSARRSRERAAELLDLVGLGQRARHLPRELSGGEQQRVAIARALVNQPGIIFADEPTANLDTSSARTVMESLVKLNQALGVTVVFVSHEPDDAQYASRLVHLSDGMLSGGPQ